MRRPPEGPAHGLALVRAEVVHDDDVTRSEGRDENLLDIEAEAVAVDRAVDEPWRLDPVMTQGRQEGHGLPAAMRHLGRQALAARRPSPERRHISLGPGLVEEHQAGSVDPALIRLPLQAPPRDVGTITLAGDQRLFL